MIHPKSQHLNGYNRKTNKLVKFTNSFPELTAPQSTKTSFIKGKPSIFDSSLNFEFATVDILYDRLMIIDMTMIDTMTRCGTIVSIGTNIGRKENVTPSGWTQEMNASTYEWRRWWWWSFALFHAGVCRLAKITSNNAMAVRAVNIVATRIFEPGDNRKEYQYPK